MLAEDMTSDSPSERSELYLELDNQLSEQKDLIREKKVILEKIHQTIDDPSRERKNQFINDQIAALVTLNGLEQETLKKLEVLVQRL